MTIEDADNQATVMLIGKQAEQFFGSRAAAAATTATILFVQVQSTNSLESMLYSSQLEQ
ncbi:hypothetical protein RchiOBHm_Chr6g0279971 [Rosa chinensis]|uniref:Uncharacterized protein n=1 Tax=Rosa chinensis TaxID=74649 RepID=A0A2P6PT89_ROSCH|nr:hypothetical protein RchiOBHm_Chr6g0279971 [Rosa chinensis]